ncbi:MULTISPECIES: LysR family transcriptional regulator ArgP [unclassified Ruegeria]|uniref:LysR family transcriptional regulator ArgP n=1 Tax=unclassified Ruegeria TaxID=2625375 RepID=UPI0014881004|nr:MULTISPECIES: LysR family transcriptional regulator ArgP [unclassified Ruegeria]
MQFDPNHLSALAAILRHGSFDAAADELSVTPSAISQRIKALEDRLGVTLVHRGTPCTGTPAGLRIAQHASSIDLLEAQLNRDLSLDQNHGAARVRIAVPADVLATWFMDAMAAVDGLLFDLVIDDQDHSAEWLRRGEVSAAITVGGQTITGCDTFSLGQMRYLATASPSFADKWFPDGVTSKALQVAPCLTFNRKDNLQKKWVTQVTGKRLSPPTHFVPSTQGFVEAATAGLGWGMNPERLVQKGLSNGTLCEIIPERPLDVALSWQVGRIPGPALKPLTQAVKKQAVQSLRPPA